MKRCSISIVIRKKKIKTAIRYNFTPMRMAIKKKQTENEIASVVQDVEELKSSSSADGNDGLGASPATGTPDDDGDGRGRLRVWHNGRRYGYERAVLS